MTAATDLPSAIAEIKATLYRNAVGAITAVKLQQLLIDIVTVLDTIAIQATDAEVSVLTPGLLAAAGAAGAAEADAAVPSILQAAVGAATTAIQPLLTQAAGYATAALASENAAQAILNSYLDDGIQGLSLPGPPFDDGVQQ